MLLHIPSSSTSFLLDAPLGSDCSDLTKGLIIQDCPIQPCSFSNGATFEDLQEEIWATRSSAKTVICLPCEMTWMPRLEPA